MTKGLREMRELIDSPAIDSWPLEAAYTGETPHPRNAGPFSTASRWTPFRIGKL